MTGEVLPPETQVLDRGTHSSEIRSSAYGEFGNYYRAGKGEGRPINTFEERARAIGEYMGTLDPYVPYTVVEFHGDAIKLARKESPDVIVRGYDQQREIGLPCGIIQLGNYGDYSTTSEVAKSE